MALKAKEVQIIRQNKVLCILSLNAELWSQGCAKEGQICVSISKIKDGLTETRRRKEGIRRFLSIFFHLTYRRDVDASVI